MTKIRIVQLVWDEWNVEHIKKHNVGKSEIEEAVSSVNAHRQGYSGRIVLIGRVGKRILAMVLRKIKPDQYYIITARDADKIERRLLYEKESK